MCTNFYFIPIVDVVKRFEARVRRDLGALDCVVKEEEKDGAHEKYATDELALSVQRGGMSLVGVFGIPGQEDQDETQISVRTIESSICGPIDHPWNGKDTLYSSSALVAA